MATAVLTGRSPPPLPQQQTQAQQRAVLKEDQQRCIKLVGKRLKVRYTNGVWYPGVVRQWNSRRGHRVAFDDGDVLWTKEARVDLTTLNCVILGPHGKQATAQLLPSPRQLQLQQQQQSSSPPMAGRPAKRKSPLQRIKAAAASAPPPTSGQRSPPADTVGSSYSPPPLAVEHAGAGAAGSARRKRTKRLAGPGGTSAGRIQCGATTRDSDPLAHASASTSTPTATTATTATTAGTTVGIPPCIPRTASGKIIGIRTTQPLPPAPPEFSTPLSSPLCDASVIVAHRPSEVREAIDRLRDHSVHLPVGTYLDRLVTLFTCIDSVVPLYAARGQTLTFLHAVEVAASQLHSEFGVRQFAQVVALRPQSYTIRRCTAAAASNVGIARDRRRLRADPTAPTDNWFIEWPAEDSALCRRSSSGSPRGGGGGGFGVGGAGGSGSGSSVGSNAVAAAAAVGRADAQAVAAARPGAGRSGGPAAVLKRRALDFRRAAVSWLRRRHGEFLRSRSVMASQWVPEASGWHADFDLDAAVGGVDGANLPQARLPSAQPAQQCMAALRHAPATAHRLRREMFLRDDDDDDVDVGGGGGRGSGRGAPSDYEGSEQDEGDSGGSGANDELAASGVDLAVLRSLRERSGQRARRLDRVAQRKRDSDFKQLLPLCDLIYMRFRGAKNKTSERLDVLIEAVRSSDRSGTLATEEARARVVLLARLLPNWCKIVRIPTFAGKKKKVDKEFLVVQKGRYERKQVQRSLLVARAKEQGAAAAAVAAAAE